MYTQDMGLLASDLIFHITQLHYALFATKELSVH
jgi:hypothetical protein